MSTQETQHDSELAAQAADTSKNIESSCQSRSLEMETGGWPFSCSHPDAFPFWPLAPLHVSSHLWTRPRPGGGLRRQEHIFRRAGIQLQQIFLISAFFFCSCCQNDGPSPRCSPCAASHLPERIYSPSTPFLLLTAYFQSLLSCFRNFGGMFVVGIKQQLHICTIHLAGNERWGWGEHVNIYV